jgi:hypothetical protein
MSQAQEQQLAKRKRGKERWPDADQFVKRERRLNNNKLVPEISGFRFIIEDPAAEIIGRPTLAHEQNFLVGFYPGLRHYRTLEYKLHHLV